MTLKRSAAPQRTKPPKRSGRIKPKKRKPSEFARIYGSKERVEWVKSQPCFVCGDMAWGDLCIVNAHGETGGTSYKADYTTIIPLCSTVAGDGCHDVQHQHGWAVLSDLNTPHKRNAAAAATQRAWLIHFAKGTHAF